MYDVISQRLVEGYSMDHVFLEPTSRSKYYSDGLASGVPFFFSFNGLAIGTRVHLITGIQVTSNLCAPTHIWFV